MTPVRVTVVEDDAELRNAIREVLEDEGFSVDVLATASEVLERSKAHQLGALVLFDLELDGRAEFETIEALKAAHPALPIVALTSHVGDDWVFPALEAGCSGYVIKMEAVDHLGRVAREVLGGGSPLSSMVGRRLLTRLFPEAPALKEPLSDRELSVIRELAEGFTYEQISLRLGLSMSTVRSYSQRAYRKLGVHTKSEATATAGRLRLL